MVFPQPPSQPFKDADARRSYIRHSIAESDWSSRSGASILDDLRESGIGIRTQDFYNIRREKVAEIQRAEEFRALEDDTLVPYSMMNEQTGVSLTMRAQYRLRLTVQDPETGQMSYVYRSIADDVHYTKGEIESFAESLFQMGGEGYNFNIVETTLHDVWLEPGGRLTG